MNPTSQRRAWLLAKLAEEPQRHEVEVAVHEAVEAKLRLAVLASLVVHNLLANLVEASVLGEIRDVAVHLAIDLNVLDDVLAIGFQAAVEVVEVLDAAHLACRGVEELGGNGFRERVALPAVHLIAAHQIVSVLCNHTV